MNSNLCITVKLFLIVYDNAYYMFWSVWHSSGKNVHNLNNMVCIKTILQFARPHKFYPHLVTDTNIICTQEELELLNKGLK